MIKKFFVFVLLGASVSISCMENTAPEAKLILLNGASSAGKTTLAKELLALYNSNNSTKPALHMSIDDYYAEVAKDLDYLQVLKKEVRKKGMCYKEEDEFYAFFHHQILDKLEQGNTVIVDHCFINHPGFINFLYVFKQYYHYTAFIKVFCTYEVAQKRLQERNKSSDERQHRNPLFLKNHYEKHYATIYDNKEYDETVDTSNCDPSEAAQKIMSILHRNKEAMQANYTLHKHKLESSYPPECLIS